MDDRTWAFDAIANHRVHGVKWLSVTLEALEVCAKDLEDLENAEDAGVPERDLWENTDGVRDQDPKLTKNI